MEQFLIWKILNIDETKDTTAIKNAYHERLKTVNPEDDQAGFMQLREAYEHALEAAKAKETDECEEDEYEALKDGSEADRFIYHMNILYQDLKLRTDEAEWDSLMRSYEDDLDGELQERVLAYIMGHHQLPWAIWKILDKKFHYVAETELLREKFPDNFLTYINYYITHDSFLNFDLFEGKTDCNVDGYINRYLDLKGAMENLEDIRDREAVASVEREFEILEEYDIHHPFVDTEKLRFCLMMKEERPLSETVLEDADRLCSEYPDDFYINYYAGMIFLEFHKIAAARAIFEHLAQLDENAFLAKMGLMKTMMAEENYADAKEQVLDLLDTEERNADLNNLLEELNAHLVPDYEARMTENPQDAKNIIELGWCYFQQQRFKDVERVLNSLPPEKFDEYDYINLTGRNYLALDQYEKALDYLLRWRSMIDETVDDGTKESKKRLNRKGFAHFAVGLAHWKLGQKELGFTEIKAGISFEYADGYRMSYCDQLAQLYLEDEEYEKVYEICNSLIKEDEGFYPAYLRRQEAAYALHRGQEVIDDFYAAKHIYPGYVKPYVFAMRVFFYAGQYSDALNIYDQAREENLHSDELQLLYYKSKRIVNKGKTEELRRLVREFYSFKTSCMNKQIIEEKKQDQNKNPIDHPDEYTDLETFSGLYLEDALYRLALDDTASAKAGVEEGLKVYPENIGLTELKADILWDEKKYEEAFSCYQRLLELGYEAPDVYMMIGKYYKLKSGNQYNINSENAITSFEKVHELDLENQECLYYLSRLYRVKFRAAEEDVSRNAYEKAVFYAKKLYELDQCAFNAIELGLSYEAGCEYHHALSYYLKASELEPDNIYAHNNAGNLYLKQNKLPEARLELLQAVKLEHDDEPTMVYELLADLSEREQKYADAVNYLKRQLKRHPKDEELLFRLKGLYEKLHDHKSILGVLQKLYEYGFIKKYELCYDSAKYYYLDGSKFRAYKLYREALLLTKKDKEAQKRVISSKAEWKK